jgi:hypothetical protein
VAEPPRFMDAWQSRQQGLEQPATSLPPADRGPRPNYAAKALAEETARVAAAPKGTRQAELNTAGLKLGRLVGGGLLPEDAVAAALYEAAIRNGHVRDDGAGRIRGWIARAVADGARNPRDPGEAQNADSRPVRDLGPVAGSVVQSLPATGGPTVGPDPVAGYLQPAGTYLRSLPDKPDPVWGSGDTVLWAQGEALMIAGSPGLGKTTLAGQLVRARLGFQRSVLDMPVLEGEERLLYLMMDRPRQIARRLMQQFSTDELEQLDARMELGVGPPPKDLARFPDLLTELCLTARADTVVVDSLKDAAIGLVEDEVGAGWNRARQLAVAAGVQVLELHHLVKRGANGKDPETLADVYGSGHLTSGAGSVLVLLGDAGSPIVKVRHLKPVAEPFGPAELVHDHARGVTTVHHRVNLLELLAITGVQTPRSAACQLFDTDKPKPAETERARRQLEKLVESGRAIKRAGHGERPEHTYHPLTARGLTELRQPATEPVYVQNTLETEE